MQHLFVHIGFACDTCNKVNFSKSAFLYPVYNLYIYIYMRDFSQSGNVININCFWNDIGGWARDMREDMLTRANK